MSPSILTVRDFCGLARNLAGGVRSSEYRLEAYAPFDFSEFWKRTAILVECIGLQSPRVALNTRRIISALESKLNYTLNKSGASFRFFGVGRTSKRVTNP